MRRARCAGATRIVSMFSKLRSALLVGTLVEARVIVYGVSFGALRCGRSIILQ